MFYTIYKITNMVNGKIYIGKHQTKDLDDGYMGSGKSLKSAFKKYGFENFSKEILFVFDNEADMNAKESEIVNEEFVKKDTNYNLCHGGKGGWGYLNSSGKSNSGWKTNGTQSAIERSARGGLATAKKIKNDPCFKQVFLSKRSKFIDAAKNSFLGKSHTKETKDKIGSINSKHQAGSGNSQFGTMWITNGQENKKIKKDSNVIPEGWYKGYNPKRKSLLP